MRIAYVSLPERGQTDAVLRAAAALLDARGLRLAGALGLGETGPACQITLRLLPDGPDLCVSQSLGAAATGCRLDGAAIDRAASAAEPALATAEALVLNRFGPQEATGRGFVPMIVQALERGLPVLLGVAAGHLPAFLAFSAGLAVALPGDPSQMADWVTASDNP